MMDTFKCGHGRGPANTYSSGRCKACKRAYNHAYHVVHREHINVTAGVRRAANQGQKVPDTPLINNAGLHQAAKTHCPSNHEYTEENTYRRKNGHRGCRECARARNHEYRKRHRVEKAAYDRAKYADNPGYHAAAAKAWRDNNRAHCRQYGKLKYHRKRAAGVLTLNEWRAILDRYGSLCLACGSDAPPTIDHVIPLSQGGLNTTSNVQPLCGPCNFSKGTKTVDYRQRASCLIK